MLLKNKKLSAKMVLLFVLQVITLAFVFVLLADRQTIFLIKDFVQSLNLSADLQSLLSRGYVALKMMFDLPSCIGVCVFLIQLVCATWTLQAILLQACPIKVDIEADKVEKYNDIVDTEKYVKITTYLENHRLLN